MMTKVSTRNSKTGKFTHRLQKNDRVMWQGKTWRVCNESRRSSNRHTEYKLQRGSQIEWARTDFLTPVTQ